MIFVRVFILCYSKNGFNNRLINVLDFSKKW